MGVAAQKVNQNLPNSGISVQVAKLLPNNFYVYVPPIESKEKDKDKPALVMSNSKVYPFIYVEP